MSYSRVAFVADDSPQAEDALKSLTKAYGQNDVKKADVVVALGGDGFMLEALHTHMDKNVPIFGMHRGTIGFLMNKYDEQDLFERLNQAEEMVFHPLRMTALTSGSADRLGHSCSDADQRFSPAPVARRHTASYRYGSVCNSESRKTPSQRGCGPRRGARRCRGNCAGRPVYRHEDALRPRTQSGRAHHRRTVPALVAPNRYQKNPGMIAAGLCPSATANADAFSGSAARPYSVPKASA